MPKDAGDRLLVAIAGPTASGKSALAIEVALAFGGEIVNCDSAQVYRGLDIGTAKLSEGDRRGIPHHLIDILDPHEAFSAGEFAARASQAIEGIASRGAPPIVCGGTGFYLRALLTGLADAPGRDAELRARLSRRTGESLHRLLRRFDAESAKRIHGNDHPKLVRALEVLLLTRRPMTEMFQTERRGLVGYESMTIVLDPPREALYHRIHARCEAMFAEGLIDEAARLLARGAPRDAPAWRAVGYRQALAVLDGSTTYDQAVTQTKQATRNYAKRQTTWFRNQHPEALRLEGFGDERSVVATVLDGVGQALKKRGER